MTRDLFVVEMLADATPLAPNCNNDLARARLDSRCAAQHGRRAKLHGCIARRRLLRAGWSVVERQTQLIVLQYVTNTRAGWPSHPFLTDCAA
jgi:hypothetical protein